MQGDPVVGWAELYGVLGFCANKDIQGMKGDRRF